MGGIRPSKHDFFFRITGISRMSRKIFLNMDANASKDTVQDAVNQGTTSSIKTSASLKTVTEPKKEASQVAPVCQI